MGDARDWKDDDPIDMGRWLRIRVETWEAARAEIDRLTAELATARDHLNAMGDLATGGGAQDAAEPNEYERRLLAEGRKIQAVKEYRARRNVCLRMAKDAFDALPTPPGENA